MQRGNFECARRVAGRDTRVACATEQLNLEQRFDTAPQP